MRVSIILGNPRPGSFCHAIANTVAAQLAACGHTTVVHDLQSEGFDPVITADEVETRVSANPLVEQHCRELADADGLIVIHPVWWGGPPAILKGWIDRVVRRGVAYDVVPNVEDSRMGHVGRLRVQAAIVFNTADTPADLEESLFRDSIGVLWKNYIETMCGIPVLERHSFSVMGTSTAEVRREWLGTVSEAVTRLFPANMRPV